MVADYSSFFRRHYAISDKWLASNFFIRKKFAPISGFNFNLTDFKRGMSQSSKLSHSQLLIWPELLNLNKTERVMFLAAYERAELGNLKWS